MLAQLPFRHQAVRDLAWVMASPCLLASDDTRYDGAKVDDRWCQTVYRENLDWLDALDRDPTALQRWLARSDSPLLGAYFEQLLAFWVQHLPEIRLLARNLLVEGPQRRIGEFDLLFRDRSRGAIVHWELAVKYYLHHDRGDDRWLGPNPRDSLSRKLEKVFGRQLQLHRNPLAQQLLQQRWGLSEVRPQAFIKGYLLYPVDSDWRNPSAIPAGVSQGHLKGWWCAHPQIGAWLAQRPPEHRWCLLPRLQRLSPVHRETARGLVSRDSLLAQLADHFNHHYRGLLVAELAPGASGWQEVSRGFVVHRHWPA